VRFGSMDEECRMRAMLCVELAVTARTPQLKATFVELSMQWEKLANIREDLRWSQSTTVNASLNPPKDLCDLARTIRLYFVRQFRKRQVLD